jgi:hypothetical protein
VSWGRQQKSGPIEPAIHTRAQWHRLNLSHNLIASMPPRRQTLFRRVYAHDFTARPHEAGDNCHYSLTNRSL